MSQPAKRFRIELAARSPAPARTAARPGTTLDRQQEILDAIRALSDKIAPAETVSAKILEDYKAEFTEARKLKHELDEIYTAIIETKRELATLHHTGFKGAEMLRVTDELDAIVTGTEKATEAILASAEAIDGLAGDLAVKLRNSANKDMIGDVQDHVVHIFEACNFQDLTGQRITKVVNTLRFVETRVIRMMEIWGGLESFADVVPDETEKPQGDRALLNGPALPTDEGRATQDEIDALFD